MGRTKSFDCVEMKRRAQQKLMAEYEARKKEFASYVDFINARSRNSGLAAEIREAHRETDGGSQPGSMISNQ